MKSEEEILIIKSTKLTKQSTVLCTTKVKKKKKRVRKNEDTYTSHTFEISCASTSISTTIIQKINRPTQKYEKERKKNERHRQ